MIHLGIYTTNNCNRLRIIDSVIENSLLPKTIDTADKTGALLSSITIEKIIDEEFRHDRFPVTSTENTSLESMSSGQQKMALATYLFNQKPDYIILDDIHSNIDPQSLQSLIDMIEKQSGEITFIQLFYRKKDLLTFIDKVVCIDENLSVDKILPSDEFLKTTVDTAESFTIPFPRILNETLYFDPVIELHAVTTAYGNKAVLDSVDWTVRAGEFWQLKGPIGSGKSTLLSMIIGDNPKAYGQNMLLFGMKKGTGESIWDIKKHIGYFYPKMTQLFNHRDTVENMIISGFVDSIGLYVKPGDWQRFVAREWMKVLGSSYAGKQFQMLSPGQQRIVLVVRAIVKQPPLLILDEPTAGLDDLNARLFVDLINAIAREKKVAIIYVSHRNEENLQPDNILELIPSPDGSKAKIIKK